MTDEEEEMTDEQIIERRKASLAKMKLCGPKYKRAVYCAHCGMKFDEFNFKHDFYSSFSYQYGWSYIIRCSKCEQITRADPICVEKASYRLAMRVGRLCGTGGLRSQVIVYAEITKEEHADLKKRFGIMRR